MGTFGEKLQREREMRSISLDEIAESTKISARMLRALEEEEFKKLPGGIFNKGFVRAYSRYLGLDEEQAVTDFLAAESESERKNREHASEDQAHLSDEIAGRNGHHRDNVYNIRASAEVPTGPEPAQAAGFMTTAIVLVIVLGVGGFGWKYFRNAGNTANAAQPPAQAVAPIAQPVQQPITPVVSSPTASTSNSTPANSAEPTAATPDKSTPPEPDSSAPTPSASNLNLEVHTNDKSWIEVKSDGAVAWQGELGASSKRSFHAERELVIKLGNAGAVELSYNGKPLPRFSADTKTKTLTFTADSQTNR